MGTKPAEVSSGLTSTPLGRTSSSRQTDASSSRHSSRSVGNRRKARRQGCGQGLSLRACRTSPDPTPVASVFLAPHRQPEAGFPDRTNRAGPQRLAPQAAVEDLGAGTPAPGVGAPSINWGGSWLYRGALNKLGDDRSPPWGGVLLLATSFRIGSQPGSTSGSSGSRAKGQIIRSGPLPCVGTVPVSLLSVGASTTDAARGRSAGPCWHLATPNCVIIGCGRGDKGV